MAKKSAEIDVFEDLAREEPKYPNQELAIVVPVPPSVR